MKAILVDVNENTVKEVDIEDKLETYHKLIDCKTISIVTRPIGGKMYDFVIDDNGRYIKQPSVFFPTNEESYCKPEIYGSVIICNSKGPELASLTNEDIENIKNNIVDITISDVYRDKTKEAATTKAILLN